MRHPPWKRALALLVAFWLAVVLLEPAALHACPVHGRAGTAHEHASASVPRAHGAMHHSSHAPDRPQHCTCLGVCCCAPAALIVAATPSIAAIPASIISAPTFARVGVRVRLTAPRHARPPAIGPPDFTA